MRPRLRKPEESDVAAGDRPAATRQPARSPSDEALSDEAFADAETHEEAARAGGAKLFRNRNFALFFSGQLISSCGNWLQNAAQGVLVLHLSGSPTMVGLTTGAMFFPALPLALVGGRLADRFDRRRLLILMQILAAAATAVLAVLAATGHATVAAVLIVAFVVGIQFALSIPATFALLPSLVEPEQLGPAIGMNSVTYNIARIIGPLISTAAITLVGFAFAFGLNSLTFLALIVVLLLIRPRPIEGAKSRERESSSSSQEGSIKEGVDYVRRAPRIRLMLLGVLVGAAAFDPIFTLAPVFAAHVYGRPPADGGLLMAAFGAGAILAGLSSSRFLKGTTGLRYLTPSMLLFAAGLVLFVLSPVFWMACASLFVAGVGSLLAMIAWTTGIQHEVSEQFRGRVMAMWTLAFLGTRTFAGPISGGLATSVSEQAAVIALMIPLVAVALFGAPRLRR